MNSNSFTSIALVTLTCMGSPDQGSVSCNFIKTDLNQTPTASEEMEYETTDINQTSGFIFEIDVADLEQSLLSLKFFPNLPPVDEEKERLVQEYIDNLIDNDEEEEILQVEEDL